MPELFSIETDAVRAVWSRPRRKAPLVSLPPAVEPYGLQARGLAPGVQPAVRLAEGDPPYLFEQTGYTLFVQGRGAASVGVRHRDPALLAGLHRSAGGGVVHGTVNFGTQVGRSTFIVEVDGVPHCAFEVEVYPSKLDYRRDYEALRDDVQEIAAGLVQEYLRATFQPGRLELRASPSTLGWIAALHQVMDGLEQALRYAARHPHWGTARTRQALRAERIRRPDAALHHTIQRGGGRGAWQRSITGLPVRAWLPAPRLHPTLDTPEHRWLAAQGRNVQARLRLLHAAERHRPLSPRRRQALTELEALQRRAEQLLQLEPLRAADASPPSSPSLRLLTAPGYREAYQAFLTLQRGLHLEGEPLQLGLKDLHVLYEYWCFLTLVRLAAAALQAPLPAARLLAVEEHGLRLRLRKGRAQRVRFGLSDGRRLDLDYNPRFAGKGYLVPQQPDMVITLRRRDGTALRAILDAKYRLDASPHYVARYGTPGPPTEALNDLHRYRDAIRARGRSGGQVVQAIALFPYREAEPGAFAASRHGQALTKVGVGALPLLPGATAYLSAWLRGLLADDRARAE